ncbi:MAG: integral rane sensor signal transduction histidine kinase [Paenibacillus sp.]|nr:integral rane sensor signal transduction histidine kinase [Paenibacillus sp.]
MFKRLFRLLLLRDYPLTMKLLYYSALLVVVPMLTVGYFSYVRSSEVLEEEAKQSSWQIIEQVKTHVEYYVRDFEVATLKIVNHPNTQKLMTMSTLEEIQQSGIRNSIQQLLYNETYSRGLNIGTMMCLWMVHIFSSAE